MYPGRRRRAEGRGAAVPYGWPGSGGGGAGARAAAGCHRRGDGEVTGHRGSRAAAGGGHKKECPAPCSGPTAAALPLLHSLDLRLGLFPGRRSRLGAWAWAQRGGGSPRRGGSGDGAGAGAVGPRAGVMAGHQGQAALEDQGRKRSACDWCPAVRIRGTPGRSTPMMVNTLVGLSAPSLRGQGRGGWGHGAGCRHSGQEAMPGRVWPAAWRGTRGFALTHPPVLLYAFAFPASFSRRTKRPAGASIPRRI